MKISKSISKRILQEICDKYDLGDEFFDEVEYIYNAKQGEVFFNNNFQSLNVK